MSGRHVSINTLCEYIARNTDGAIVLEMPAEDVLVREGVFRPSEEAGKMEFHRCGLAAMLARKMGLEETLHTTSSNWIKVGELRGRTIYYSDKPRENFFAYHKEHSALIIGDNTVRPPPGWKGSAVLLSELVAIDQGGVIVDESALLELSPETARAKKRAGSRAARGVRAAENDKRRKLIFLCLHEHVREYRLAAEKDKAALEKVPKLTVSKILAWFKKNHAEVNAYYKQIERDRDWLLENDATFRKIWEHLGDPRTYVEKVEKLLLAKAGV